MSNPYESSLELPDKQIIARRRLKAPRKLVWQAFADPQQITQWWGPDGFTTTTFSMEMRPGGKWRYVMHGPDGIDYQNRVLFLEVVPLEKIVYKHSGSGETEPISFQTTILFEEVGNETIITHIATFPSNHARQYVIDNYKADVGAKQHLGNLASHVEGARADKSLDDPNDGDFVISRTFDAPRELVFKAWSDPQHFAAWWGPHIMTNPICEIDFRPGGAYRIVMQDHRGKQYPVSGVYREIDPPSKLVMTVDCSEHDDNWHNLVWPLDERFQERHALDGVQTVLFEEVGGKTKLTVRTRFNSPQIRDRMIQMGMNEGWTESLEKLATYLPKM